MLAGGIDVVYPPEHKALQAAIGERGCLLTEMPVGFVPRGKDFPRRNRIISGVSLGVLIVEAARRSGTLVTARLRATLVTEASDLLSALTPLTSPPAMHVRDDGTAGRPEGRSPTPVPMPPELSDGDRRRVVQALGPRP